MSIFKSLARLAVLGSLSVATAASAQVVVGDPITLDSVTIRHDLSDSPLLFEGNTTLYQLAGQSAFIQARTNSGTSGGQLDGARGFGSINFVEIFPPADPQDYLTYSYLGIVETRGTDGQGLETVLDRSLVVGFQGGFSEPPTVESLFNYSESFLVEQFTTVFDSPAFLDMAFNQVANGSGTRATMGVATSDCGNNLWPTGCSDVVSLQSGDELTLIAFIGGDDGNLGVQIGTLDVNVTRYTNVVLQPVPEPGTYAMMAVGLLLMGFMARRRASF